jgi:hypothetical protein
MRRWVIAPLSGVSAWGTGTKVPLLVLSVPRTQGRRRRGSGRRDGPRAAGGSESADERIEMTGNHNETIDLNAVVAQQSAAQSSTAGRAGTTLFGGHANAMRQRVSR